MRSQSPVKITTLVLGITVLVAASTLTSAFTYDPDGRLATAFYGADGRCHGYSYDGSGNRTAVLLLAQSSQLATWGSSTWGCIRWQP